MEALIVIGSNCGNREERVETAFRFLKSLGTVISCSDIYESQDCLGSGKKYLNSVLKLDTELPYRLLAAKLKEYEVSTGRDEEARRRGDVPVDIDIVVWNGKIMREKDFNSSYFKRGLAELKPELELHSEDRFR